MTKHLTNRELETRAKAEKGLARKTRVSLRAPDWLSPEARKIWDGLKRKLRKVDLLDNLDAELLAVYCDAQAQYQALSKRISLGGTLNEATGELWEQAPDELVKQAQSWARLIAGYAEKLGLSPQARARLAKKKAEAEPVDEFEALLDSRVVYDVTDYGSGER
jgi:P27 family predicted phage terminase small subunit